MLHPFFGVRKVAIALALIGGLLICRAALAADAASFEAETTNESSRAISIASDADASGGAALHYAAKADASKVVQFSGDADTLTVRTKGIPDGDVWPVMEVFVDGTKADSKVARQIITSSSYAEYSFAVNVASGSHTLYVKADDNMGADQELFVDKVIFAGATETTSNGKAADTDCDNIANSSDTLDNRYGVLSTNSAYANRTAFIKAINADKDLYVCGGETQASDNFDIANAMAIDTTGASGSVHMERGAYFDLSTNLMGFRFIGATNFELYNWRVMGTNDGTSQAGKTATIFRSGSDIVVDGGAADATSMDGISSPAGYGEVNGTPGSGLIFYATIRPTVKNMRFINTGRDALHYATTQDAVAEHIFTRHSGDDGVAFLNYESYTDRSGFRATDLTVIDSYKARGITVVGQRSGTIDGFRIDGTYASGVYIVEEDNSSYQTREPSSVTVKNGCINNAGQIKRDGKYAPHRNAVSYGSVGRDIRFESISAYNHGGSLVGKLASSSEGLRENAAVTNVKTIMSAC
jgi:hypothetical protein